MELRWSSPSLCSGEAKLKPSRRYTSAWALAMAPEQYGGPEGVAILKGLIL
jgi:hypothetical protein